MANTEIYIPWEGWKLVRQIGQGSFGRVYEIERRVARNIEKAAMKVIPISAEMLDDVYGSQYDENTARRICENSLNSIRKEYQFMRELRGNPNIVRCDDMKEIWHQDGIGCDVYLKMELLTPLNQIWKTENISEDDVTDLGRDICRALISCEQHKIIHRDIKPQNILVSPGGTYKLGDFGTAKVFEHTSSATKAGTETYMAPEVIRREKYGRDVDTYSLGLVMYRMLNKGQLPFLPPGKIPTADDRTFSLQKRLSGAPIPAPAEGSAELKRIVLKACSFNRIDRYSSAADMLDDIDMIGEETLGMYHMHNGSAGFTEEPARLNIWLTASEAVNGCSKAVTIDSRIYTIDIPANSAAGDRFEICSQNGKLAGIVEVKGIKREATPVQEPVFNTPPAPEPVFNTPPTNPTGNRNSRTILIIACAAAAILIFAAGILLINRGHSQNVPGEDAVSGTDTEAEAETEESVPENQPEPEAPVTEPEPSEPAQGNAPRVSMDDIRYVSASSQLDGDSKGNTYYAEHITDNDLSTGWVEGVNGNGEGQVVHIVLKDTRSISGFIIYAGYQKSDKTYRENARPATVLIELSDGSSFEVSLNDEKKGQQITFPEPADIDYIDITIRSVYPGSKFEDTVISEIYLF